MITNSRQSLIVKRSPVAFVKMLLWAELVAFVLFLIAKPLAFYKELYNQYAYQRFISYEYDVIFVLLVGVLEVALTLYIFLRWYQELYRIGEDNVTHRSGVFVRRQSVLYFADVRSVDVREGLLGRTRGYGTVTLHLRDSNAVMKLKDISNPKRYAAAIVARKRDVSGVLLSGDEIAPDIEGILSGREQEATEFKSTLRWDVRKSQVNKDLERAVVKSVAAFLNSGGGYLVLGVDDAGALLGLTHDYKTLQRGDADGFENHFTQVFNSMIGPEFRRFVHLHFHLRDGKEVCVVRVAPAPKPVYVACDGKEEFYIRTGNITTSLQFREANAYIASRWSA